MFNLYVYEHFTYWKITPAISRKVISVKKNFPTEILKDL